jgi:hypothetical protein
VTRVSLPVAYNANAANAERKRHPAVAVSLRLMGKPSPNRTPVGRDDPRRQVP